jgi:molybdopterin molybdotransferase
MLIARKEERITELEGQLNDHQAKLKTDFTKKTGLTHYLKGFATDSEVQILEAQESYKLNAFVRANCLVEIKEEQNFLAKGEVVNLFYFHEAWV